MKKSSGDNAVLTQQIQDLQTANLQLTETHQKELHQFKVDAAIDKALTDGGAKNIKVVKALLELDDDIQFDKDGTVKGLSAQLEKLKGDESSKFLFNEVTQQPTFKGFQPGQTTISWK